MVENAKAEKKLTSVVLPGSLTPPAKSIQEGRCSGESGPQGVRLSMENERRR